MAPSSVADDRKAGRAFLSLAIVALLLAAALSGAWYYMAHRLDVAVRAAIEAAAGEGVTIDCENQSVFGYPFRIGLHCDRLGIDAPEETVQARGGELRTAAQLYRPTSIVAELDGPLAIAAAGSPPIDIRWDLAQASAHFWTKGLDRFSLVLEAPVIALGGGDALRPLVRSDHLEAHARRREDSLDLAVTDRGVTVLEPGLSGLPAFDLSADVTIDDAASWLSGERPGATIGEALAGKAGTIRALRLALAATGQGGAAPQPGGVEISGPFSVDDEGRVSGDFEVVLTDAAAIGDLVSRLAPPLAGVARSLASGIAFAGRTENGRTTIRVGVRDGEASLGILPLGRIPALR